MDLLSQLMEHFSIRTGVFYSGNLCGVSSFNAQQGKEGHLHVLSAEELSLSSAHTEHRHLSQPCIVYLPKWRHWPRCLALSLLKHSSARWAKLRVIMSKSGVCLWLSLCCYKTSHQLGGGRSGVQQLFWILACFSACRGNVATFMAKAKCVVKRWPSLPAIWLLASGWPMF